MLQIDSSVLADAKRLSEDFHRAVLSDDLARAGDIADTFRALLARANGEKGSFGLFAPGGAGTAIMDALQAAPGSVPHWGQDGLFVTDTPLGRFMVEFRSFLGFGPGFSFHAVDLGAPFVSNTGFRSFHTDHLAPLPVCRAAAAAYCVLVERHGLNEIDIYRRNTLASDIPAFARFTDPAFNGSPTTVNANGQLGFGF